MNKNNHFFDEPLVNSQIKAAIVKKYFWAWARVIMPNTPKIAYIDLFAGPGRYDDGSKSTPLLVLESAIADSKMSQMLVTMFNDIDENNVKSLQTAISELPGIENLKYKPQIYNEEVGQKIVGLFEKMKLVPTLFFVDPWGYKGLSLRLINSVLKNWGCDCIFFFNYNRINMGVNNTAVEEHMHALFGEERAANLKTKLEGLPPERRELTILEDLTEALKVMGGEYVLPFTFKNESGNRTSHHLIFVSKKFRGYEIMKEIMANESSSTTQGVASFGYNVADSRKLQPLLFELNQPLSDLGERLLSKYAGKKMTMKEIYLSDCVGTPFIEKNYKEILKDLESNDKIITNPPRNMRRKYKGEITFGDDVQVYFPS